MIRWCLIVCCAVLAGCVASPSTEVATIRLHNEPALPMMVQGDDDSSGCVVITAQTQTHSGDETSADEALLTANLTPPEDLGVVLEPEPLFDFPVVENDKVRYLVDYYTGPGTADIYPLVATFQSLSADDARSL